MTIAVDNGVLRGVEVVGFHGFVADDTTPQRKAPIYRMAGKPLRIEGTPWSAAAADVAAFEGEVYEPAGGGEATIFSASIDTARAGWVLIIVGSWEIEHLARKPAGVHAPSESVAAFVRSLSSAPDAADARCRPVPDAGAARAWYAPMAEANAVLELVRRRAKAQFLEGGDQAGLEAAWKLFGAAPGLPEESSLAVAMLHHHGFEDWREMAADDEQGDSVEEVLARGQASLAALLRTRVAPLNEVESAGPGGAMKTDYRGVLRKQAASWNRAAA
jgi:hypothetical protein